MRWRWRYRIFILRCFLSAEREKERAGLLAFSTEETSEGLFFLPAFSLTSRSPDALGCEREKRMNR